MRVTCPCLGIVPWRSTERMRWIFLALITSLALFAPATPFQQSVSPKAQYSARHHHKHHKRHKGPPKLGQHFEVSSTCYAQGSTTASGGPVYLGEVANNELPLGTRIMLDRPVFGRRGYRIEDRIGSGSPV